MAPEQVRKIGLPLAFAAACVVVLIALFILIYQRLQDLRDTPTDNLTWTLSQVEVDTLKLGTAVLDARTNGNPDLDLVRRRFNNLYGRVDTIAQGPTFKKMRADPLFSDTLAALVAGLDAQIPVMDAVVSDLIARLDLVSEALEDLVINARALSLHGIEIGAQWSDMERGSLANLLTAVEVVSGGVIVVFIVILVHIQKQSQAAESIFRHAVRANTRLKSTFEVSLDAIVVADGQGTILEFNSAAEEVFGFSKIEAVGAQMVDLIVPQQHHTAHTAGWRVSESRGNRSWLVKDG